MLAARFSSTSGVAARVVALVASLEVTSRRTRGLQACGCLVASQVPGVLPRPEAGRVSPASERRAAPNRVHLQGIALRLVGLGCPSSLPASDPRAGRRDPSAARPKQIWTMTRAFALLA